MQRADRPVGLQSILVQGNVVGPVPCRFSGCIFLLLCRDNVSTYERAIRRATRIPLLKVFHYYLTHDLLHAVNVVAVTRPISSYEIR